MLEIFLYILNLFRLYYKETILYGTVIQIYNITNIKIKFNIFSYQYILADIILPKYYDKLCLEWVMSEMLLYMRDKLFKVKIFNNIYVYLYDTDNNLYINNWINNIIVEYELNRHLYELNKGKTM
jgi:hypothetical protein